MANAVRGAVIARLIVVLTIGAIWSDAGAVTLSVSVEAASDTWPAGTTKDGADGDYTSMTDDPLGPFFGQSVHFRGVDTGGDFQVYRYRLVFDADVELQTIRVSGVAWRPGTTISLQDAAGDQIRAISPEGGNTFRTHILNASGITGRTFFLVEVNGDSGWRYRSQIEINLVGNLEVEVVTGKPDDTTGLIPILNLLLLDNDSDQEIAAKYNLRVQNNAHYRANVVANPEKNVIVNDVAVIDLDNDGDEDVLVTLFMISSTDPGDPDFYQELEMVIFRNVGNAYVKEATGLFVNMRDYTVSDFNDDGLQDIFFGNPGHDFDPFSGAQDRLLMQNSDGTLSDLTSSNLPADVFFTHSVCSGDFDNDGDADLYTANVGPNPSDHKIYENDGGGFFSDATMTLLPPEMQLMVAPPTPGFHSNGVGLQILTWMAGMT